MTISDHRVRAVVRLTLAVAILGLAVASPAGASDAPENCDAIKAALPDSTALENKVVYVDFWASWCVPCRASFPWMEGLYEKLHDSGFEIVAINVDKDPKAANKFLQKHKSSFDIVYDSTGSLAELYGLEAMPSSFLYGRDGNLATQHIGFRAEETDSLASIIDRLLAEDSPK